MNIMIIGGGKVGYFLMKSLTATHYGGSGGADHQVVLIEKQKSICEKIADEVDIPVFWGDGSALEVLKDAGVDRADVLVAATGKDEENLIICQIAKMNFNVPKTIARINNPKNIDVFKKLGVDKTVCSTQVIANMLETSFHS